MKQILTLALLLLTTNTAFGNCQRAVAETQLFNMFKVKGQSFDWASVRGRDSFREDRGLPIYVTQANTLQESVIQFRRQTLTLDGALVCLDPKRAGRILLQHPNYDGTLSVQRRGRNLDDSIIRLRKLGTLLEAYIRPADVVE